MKCKICGSDSNKIFNKKLLNKYYVDYFHCPNCEFIYTEEPFWLEESYDDAITSADTGVMSRNLECVSVVSSVIVNLFNEGEAFLDYGGGYGIFTRMMRDIGFNFFWYDLYCQNLLARGFEYTNQEVQLLTCFEVFEHFNNPIIEIEKMLSITNNILFSTETYDKEIPNPDAWWYYCFDTGQHIALYSKKTLKYIASRYNLNFYSYNNIHLITDRSIEDNSFREYVCNHDEGYKIAKRKLISRTFSDMNYVNIKNKKIENINNLNFDIYSFFHIAQDKDIIIFGTGSLSKKIIDIFRTRNINIRYLADNDSSKWGSTIYDLEVIEPENLRNVKENTLIVIGSSYYIEISHQLSNMGIKNVYHIHGI